LDAHRAGIPKELGYGSSQLQETRSTNSGKNSDKNTRSGYGLQKVNQH